MSIACQHITHPFARCIRFAIVRVKFCGLAYSKTRSSRFSFRSSSLASLLPLPYAQTYFASHESQSFLDCGRKRQWWKGGQRSLESVAIGSCPCWADSPSECWVNECSHQAQPCAAAASASGLGSLSEWLAVGCALFVFPGLLHKVMAVHDTWNKQAKCGSHKIYHLLGCIYDGVHSKKYYIIKYKWL